VTVSSESVARLVELAEKKPHLGYDSEDLDLIVEFVAMSIPLARDWERMKRIEEAARLVVEAAIQHEDDPTAETAQTLKALTKHLDAALDLKETPA
jgi:hypothetical protein